MKPAEISRVGAALLATLPALAAAQGGGLSFAFGAPGYAGSEGGTAVIGITLSGTPSAPVSVLVATLGGNATSGSDYTARSERLTWNPGDAATKLFTVVLAEDAVVDDGETFSVGMAQPLGGAVIGSPDKVPVKITSDDRARDGSVPGPGGRLSQFRLPGPQGNFRALNPLEAEPSGFKAALAGPALPGGTTADDYDYLASVEVAAEEVTTGSSVEIAVTPPEDAEDSFVTICVKTDLCVTVEMTDSSTSVTEKLFTVTDGDAATDADGSANGTVEFEAVFSTVTSKLAGTAESGGGGGGAWGALSSLLLALGVLRRRRSRR